jgi:hypothetical protein
VYCSQLKAHQNDESLQEFAAGIEQLSPRALIGLPWHFIQMEKSYTLFNRIDQGMKFALLMGGERTLVEARGCRGSRLFSSDAAYAMWWRV